MRFFLILCFVFCYSINTYANNIGKKIPYIVATHYYGFKEYSWPINYLNAIKDSDIGADLATIKKAGFNTVILLVSWTEFEPIIGKRDDAVYRKIKRIIIEAKKHGLTVMLRIPYLWSLNGTGDGMRERIAYALLNHGHYRKALLSFLEVFQNEIVKKNENIIGKFGSWEDYYVLRDFFFSDTPIVSAVVRDKFFKDTGIESIKVVRNGENYDVFNDWMDTKILGMAKDIGSYGYEIRTDSDLYKKNNELKWHAHNKFYKNESNGNLVAYWAPYFGQLNSGEKISADKAIASFNWMLDSISAETKQPVFIDQFNFFDNSPDTGGNAQIDTSQLPMFFEKMTGILAKRTSGYGFWTIRDYHHNIIYNPAFSEKLMGWKASKNVVVNKDYVTIPPGGYVSQYVPASRFLVLDSKMPSLVVDVVAGRGTVLIDSKKLLSIDGERKFNKAFTITPDHLAKGVNITIKSNEDSLNPLKVKWLGLLGHAQVGKVFDEAGKKSDFYHLIKTTNERILKTVNIPCQGYTLHSQSALYTSGIFADGWTSQNIDICKPVLNKEGVELNYYNPLSYERSAQIIVNGVVVKTIILNRAGAGTIRMCPFSDGISGKASILIKPPFTPSQLDKQSRDNRSLGLVVNSLNAIKCN